jgi:amino acid transporter
VTDQGRSAQAMPGEPACRPGLRRELRFTQTASVSIGVMAPTLAMSVTGVAAATALGRAAPLAFAVAALGVGLVAYGFIRLAGEFSHAGSVYAFVGNTLGPRPGFLAGWALLGTYLVFPPVSIMGVAVFGRAFLDTAGLAHDADWYPLALAAWAVIWVLAARGVRPTTRSVLVFEVVSVCLILVLMGVACVVAQTLGFGTSAVGVSAFRHSQAPLGDLAERYVGTPLAALLDLGAALSALGAGLGGVTVAARMMFAFGRDGLAPRRLGGVSAPTGVPRRALAAEMLIGLAMLTAFRLAGTSALNVFFYLATIGTLSLLVMYVLTNMAAARHLGRRSRWQVVVPAGGVLIAGFVLYHNVWPVPPPPYEFFPYLVLGWLLAGLIITAVLPGFSAKAADGLQRAAAK